MNGLGMNEVDVCVFLCDSDALEDYGMRVGNDGPTTRLSLYPASTNALVTVA